MTSTPIILGIETSCDETAAAIVRGDRRILSNVISSHVEEQQPYGGVVPEVSSRAHLARIEAVIHQVFSDATLTMPDIDAIAVTSGPGLIGGVIVGVMTAKAMASVLGKPLIAINHLEGHALTVRLTDAVPYPYLLLLMSGGHCQFVLVHGLVNYTLIGETLDDALGECFDKVAKMLGLGYPGGPAVERMAAKGVINPKLFPIPMSRHEGCDMSFSGLKTAVRMLVQSAPPKNEADVANICASFQWTACEAVAQKLTRALVVLHENYPEATRVVLAGGVAANRYIYERLNRTCEDAGCILTAPPVALCTDNAAMIAWAGVERFNAGCFSDADFEPRARWPLATVAAS